MSKQAYSSNINEFQAICIGTSQVVAIGASSVQSNAIGQQSSIVRLFSTKDCFIAIGQNPVVDATGNTGAFLPGGIIEYFGTNPGDKIAVIQASVSGTLYITEGQ
jgi:hypothetical protein